MTKIKQVAEKIVSRSSFIQTADQAADQSAKEIETGEFRQEVKSPAAIRLGKYGANGLVGIIALVVIAAGWFLLKYATS